MKRSLLLLALLFLVTKATLAQVPSYVPSNGLVGWWPFNGNANDVSGNGNHGTPMNGVSLTTDRNGNSNSAYNFDGIDDYLHINNLDLNTQFFTASTWVKVTNYQYNSNTALQSLFYFGTEVSGSQTFTNSIDLAIDGINYSPSLLRANLNYGYGNVGSLSVDTSWQNITVVYNGVLKNLSIYFNGQLIANSSISPDSLIVYSNDENNIGSSWSSSLQQVFNFFKGKIDDIGIWNRALTPAEITALYYSGNNPCLPSYIPTNGLVGWWPFCGNANDESGNGNHGTVNGATLTSDRYGNTNKAYNFNGLNNYIECQSNNLLQISNSYTLSLWFSSNAFNNGIYGYTLLSKITATGWYGGYEVMLGEANSIGGVNHTGNINGNFQLPYSGLNVNSWYSVIITFDGSQLKLFLNGVLVNSINRTGGLQTGSDPLRFGRRGGGGIYDQWYNGTLDDIGIWNRALSPSEIQALYLSGQPCPSIANIQGPSNVNVGSSITLTDSTSNGTWSSSNTSVATINASGVVTGIAAGTSTISYIANLTCGADTATYIVTINPNPCLPNYVPTNGLVGWWPFCGNANDESGNGNHGVSLSGSFSNDRYNNSNTCFYGNGNNTPNPGSGMYLGAMNSFPFGDASRTVSVWFKCDIPFAIGDRTLFSYGDNTFGTRFGVYLTGAGIGLEYMNGAVLTSFIPDNSWHNITVVYSGGGTSGISLFLDSVLKSTFVIGGSTSVLNTQNSFIHTIGRLNDVNNFSGYYDDIGIWNRALTPTEIQALYLSGQPCPTIATIQGPTNVNVGSTIALTDSTTNGTWSSSNTSVATINASGVVTGIAAGSTTISYIANLACGADTATYTITVNSNPCLPNYVPTNGLVGWWPFCGNANDESGNGNNGTAMNGVALTSDRNGNVNSAYSFDGVDDWIYVANSNSVNPINMTLSAWVNTNAYNNSNASMIINKGWDQGPGHYDLLVFTPTQKSRFVIGSNLYVESNSFINLNTWNLVTATIDSNVTKIYINGILENSVTQSSVNSLGSNTDPLYFGKHDYNNYPYYFNGIIDDIGIWNRALTPAEIQALYLSGQPCTVTHTTSLNICRRDSTLWNGQYYKSTGSDTVHLVSYTGCDSVDILNLNVYPLYYTVLTRYFCKGTSFVFNGQTITTPGTYYFHYTSATGCDSTVRLRALNPVTSSKVTLPICQGASITYGNQTFNSAGVYLVHLVSYLGCDSAVTLTLVKRLKTYGKLTIYRCQNDSVAYYGKYYKTNGIYTAIIPNRFGCDSVVTLNVLTNPISNSTITRYVCQGDSLLYQNKYYKFTGTYYIRLTNKFGCDSIVRLRLLYNNSSSLTTVTLCQAQTYTWNGTTYTWSMAGTYVQHFTNYKGCDSTASLKVYKGNCKGEGLAIGTTITTTEVVEGETSLNPTLAATHNFEMNLYPNPNTGRFTLENNCTTCKEMLVEIFTMDGKLLYSKTEDNTTGKINIDVQLVPGMYWVKMSNGNEGYSEMKRFVMNEE